MRPLFLTFLLASAASVAVAQDPVDFNNGCGSGWNEPLVPDEIKRLGIDFRSACANHDNCYSRCLPGGATFGEPVCSQISEAQRTSRRRACDVTFENEMTRTCNEQDTFTKRQICKGASLAYFIAVDLAGGGSFNGKEIPADYYDFLLSDDVAYFNFDALLSDLESVLTVGDLSDENLVLLTVRNGLPAVEIDSTAPTQSLGADQAISIDNTEFLVREYINYGRIDLSGATLDGQPLEVQRLDLNALDLDRIKVERTIALPQLGDQ